jgi:hypothetical protein
VNLNGLFSFYWIDQCGLTRFRWYASIEESKAREDKDDLLSGFITALMNFSREMFQGEEIAQMDLSNYHIHFASLPQKDILALVTHMDFNRKIGTKIMANVISQMKTQEIPEMSCQVGTSDWMKDYLMKAIDLATPKTLADLIGPMIEPWFNSNEIVGYLTQEQPGAPAEKKLQENLEFELSTFLDSIFWEKTNQAHAELAPVGEKIFQLKSVIWVTIDTDLFILSNFYCAKKILSMVYLPGTGYQKIKEQATQIMGVLDFC